MKQPQTLLMTYKGKQSTFGSLVYAPYIPLQFASATNAMLSNNSIKLVRKTVDFNPQIRFTKQYLQYGLENERVSIIARNAIMKKFTEEAWDWLVANAGGYETEWAFDMNSHRIWFKSTTVMTAFKLIFDGYRL